VTERTEPFLDLDPDSRPGQVPAAAAAPGFRPEERVPPPAAQAPPDARAAATARGAQGAAAGSSASPAPDISLDDEELLSRLPWSPADDALLQSLVWLTRHHGRARSAESLVATLALQGPLGPDQALRVLREAGFKAGVLKKRLADIHPLLMPCVLMLQGGEACLLTGRHELPGGEVQFEVVMPDDGFPSVNAGEAELGATFTGFVLVAAVAEGAEQPGRAGDPLLREPGSHWLWGTLRRFVPYYRAAVLAALLSNVLMLAGGLITAVVFDKVIPNQAFVTLWALAAGGGIAMLFDLFARQLRSHLIDLAGKKADLLIGAILFRQTLGVRMEHRPPSAGSYAHVQAQIETVRDFFASATLSALSDLPFVLLFVAMAFVIGGPLGWVLVGAIPVIVGAAALIQGALRRSMSSHMNRQADLQGVLVEAVEGLEDLKAAGAQGRFLRIYEESTAAAAASMLRARMLSSWTQNLSAMMQQAVTLVMLVWGVYLIHDQVITGGALIGAIMFAGRAVAPLGSVVSLATRYQGARAALQALDRQMHSPTEREAGRNYASVGALSGRVALADVSFAYPAVGGQNAPKVLKGVSLKFEPGERVAVLGRIGSGKSTVLRLLAGLYQPTEGLVEVDGIDLRQLDPVDYRARVGFVSQEPRLFTGTLRDNVLMGRAWADATLLTEVARQTGLDRLIASHPLGWDLPVGEMGSLLSGGQRQLVALARCLITRPQILLMDEPTSSMDAQSEIAFLRQLHAAAGHCTLVMVTHRPAVLELVQRVTVIDAGRVLLDGPKAQVLAALSGRKPVPPQAPVAGSEPTADVHLHPNTQPVQRAAAL
jgi:ATP-binding cassette subfamily C protein LapB